MIWTLDFYNIFLWYFIVNCTVWQCVFSSTWLLITLFVLKCVLRYSLLIVCNFIVDCTIFHCVFSSALFVLSMTEFLWVLWKIIGLLAWGFYVYIIKKIYFLFSRRFHLALSSVKDEASSSFSFLVSFVILILILVIILSWEDFIIKSTFKTFGYDITVRSKAFKSSIATKPT